MSIKRILIPTDFSETAQLAIEHGVCMSNLFNSEIILLHSINIPLYALASEGPPMILATEVPQEVQAQKLNQIASEIAGKYNTKVSTITENGNPAKRIAAAVEENNVDIIIMGTHGASGLEELLVGSNARDVVKLTTCPVISIQKGVSKVGFSNIIMPIDNDLHSRQKVNNVIELATAYKANVHLLALLETSDGMDEEMKFEIKLESVVAKLDHANIPYTKELIKGDNLAMEAINYSEKVKGDLIVIMTGHESDMTGMFLGVFAEQIVNHSKIPIMSIRPAETTIETFDLTGGTGILI